MFVSVPVLGNEARQEELEQAIHSIAARLGEMARRWDQPDEPAPERSNNRSAR